MRGALFYSIAACTLIGIPLGVTVTPPRLRALVDAQVHRAHVLAVRLQVAPHPDMALTIFALVFMDIFNTIGTLIGAAATPR